MGRRKKQAGLVCNKVVSIYIPRELYKALEQRLQGGGFGSMSALLRHLVLNRKVVTRREDMTFDNLMWTLSAIRTKLNLMGRTVFRIRGEINAHTAPATCPSTIQEAEVMFNQAEVHIEAIFEVIAKLGDLWLQE